VIIAKIFKFSTKDGDFPKQLNKISILFIVRPILGVLMNPKPEILFEWHTPQEIRDYQAKKSLRSSKRIIPITILVAVLLEIALLIPIVLILKKCGPEYEYLIWQLIKIFLLAIPGVSTFTIGLAAFEQITMRWPPKWTRKSYKITKEALLTPSDKSPKIPWKQMMFIGITPHKELKKIQMLSIFYKKQKRLIPLPNSEETDAIISFVSNHAEIEKDETLLKDIHFTKKQKKLLHILTGLYILSPFIIYFLIDSTFESNAVAPMTALICILISLFIGPGTIFMLFFYRSLYFRRYDLHHKVMGYNLITPLIIYAFTVLVFFWIMTKDILDTIHSLP